jgi:hypothetical protein
LHGGFDVQGVAHVRASLFGKVEGGKESGGLFIAQFFAHTTCRNGPLPLIALLETWLCDSRESRDLRHSC